jgi:hypothetical protein
MATDCKLCDSSCDFSDTRATLHSFVNQTPTGDTLGALNKDPRVIQWPLRNKRTTRRHFDRVLQNFDPPGHPQRLIRPNLNAVILLARRRTRSQCPVDHGVQVQYSTFDTTSDRWLVHKMSATYIAKGKSMWMTWEQDTRSYK